MRLFVAIEIPPVIREALGALGRDMREDLGAESRALRWVRPEGIHLTLRFLGEVRPADLPALTGALEKAVPGQLAPFEVEVGGVGTFPERGRPRVLWVGLRDGSGTLAALQNHVESAVSAAAIPGVKEERRPFKPHLTLARFGDVRPPAGLGASIEKHRGASMGSFAARSVSLIESLLRPQGAEYRTVREYRL